jgi:Lon protease-like protein
MGRPLEEMPLFLLDTVLFPLSPMHLHVFEERYVEMIRLCMAEDRPFGVVLIREGSEVGGEAEPYLVGTAARIEQAMIHDDGRIDLRVRGEGRFRIRQIDESRPYMVGHIEHLVEEQIEDSPRSLAVISKAREIGEHFISALFDGSEVKVARVKLHNDPQILSFLLAGMVQATNLERQHLLETTDTVERLAMMIPGIERQLEDMPRAPQKVRADDVLPRLSEN